MWKRLLILGGVLLVLAAGAVIAWLALDLPPLRLVAKNGFPPAGGPTGRTKTIEGVTFIELSPGYCLIGSHFLCDEGDLLGRLGQVFSLPWGRRPSHAGNECPPRWIEIPRAFWIAVTEITNEQYERFVPRGTRSRSSPGDRGPLIDMEWMSAEAYCAWLSTRGELAARLPSETEWEYACRAGSSSDYCFGDDPAALGEYAWFDRNSGGPPHRVGTRRPNVWGLYDLHGSVSEWCEDTYDKDDQGAPEDGTAWIEDGGKRRPALPDRVYRGGSWRDTAVVCRSATRNGSIPCFRIWGLGFRPAADGH